METVRQTRRPRSTPCRLPQSRIRLGVDPTDTHLSFWYRSWSFESRNRSLHRVSDDVLLSSGRPPEGAEVCCSRQRAGPLERRHILMTSAGRHLRRGIPRVVGTSVGSPSSIWLRKKRDKRCITSQAYTNSTPITWTHNILTSHNPNPWKPPWSQQKKKKTSLNIMGEFPSKAEILWNFVG